MNTPSTNTRVLKGKGFTYITTLLQAIYPQVNNYAALCWALARLARLTLGDAATEGMFIPYRVSDHLVFGSTLHNTEVPVEDVGVEIFGCRVKCVSGQLFYGKTQDGKR